MATTQPSEASRVISDVSKQEGGTYKGQSRSQSRLCLISSVQLTSPSPGSTAAQMQSQTTKQKNVEEAATTVGSKLENNPSSVTQEDAQFLHSRESRARSGPQKGDLASQAQSVAAANERGDTVQTAVPGGSNLTPGEQSQLDREANYIEAADKVSTKMHIDPSSVTKEDGHLLHSRETKAFGATEKGGIASKVQSLASENAGDKNT